MGDWQEATEEELETLEAEFFVKKELKEFVEATAGVEIPAPIFNEYVVESNPPRAGNAFVLTPKVALEIIESLVEGGWLPEDPEGEIETDDDEDSDSDDDEDDDAEEADSDGD